MTPTDPKETYAVKCGENSFNWTEFLTKTEYTREELDNALSLVGSWVTCACGNQCKNLPRNDFGVPLYNELKMLGVGFTGAISLMRLHNIYGSPLSFLNYKNSAIKILNDIEELSSDLIIQSQNRKDHADY